MIGRNYTPNIKPGLVLKCLIAFLLLSGNSYAQTKKLPDAAAVEQAMQQAGNSISFLENKGQWPSHVLYKADVPGGQMLATPDGMLIGKFNPQSLEAIGTYHMKLEEFQKGDRTAKKKADLGPEPRVSGHGWKLKFIGGSIASPQSIERNNESPDYYNYLLGDASTHATYVHGYTEVIYKDVYKNIDVKYYTSKDGDLENDIIARPGSDPNLLSLEIEGIEGLMLNAKGELILPTTVGEVVIPAPISYLKETGVSVDVKYLVTGNNTISFNIPDYDRKQTLVIDPIVMRWATFVSNNASSFGHCHGIDLDAAGNLYVTGQYTSTGLITVGPFQALNGGGTNIFIGKYTEPAVPGGSGSRLWQTYLGSTGENPYAILVGPDGFAYITGLTGSDLNKTYGTGFTAGTWTQRTSGGGFLNQGFIAKINPTGTGALVREIGSVSNDFNIAFYDLKVLPTGPGTFDIIDVGYAFYGSNVADGDVPAGQMPNGTVYSGSQDNNGLAFRITSNLNTIVWAKQYSSGSSNSDQFKISSIDNSGNIYVGGFTGGSTGISYLNPSAQTTLAGSQDGWLIKLNSANGTALWSRYFNSGIFSTSDILCMQLNTARTQLVIGGTTTGLAAGNTTAGTYSQFYNGGSQDFYIASLPVSGASTTWGTYFGGNSDENNMMGLNLDQNDDVYMLGYSDSKNITAVSNPIQNANYDNTNYDAQFIKLSSTGQSLLYSTYMGGTYDEFDPVGEVGIKFSNCRIYLAITSGSNNFPFTSGTLTPTKVSPASFTNFEPIVVSMANPPDLTANSITGGANQTLVCGQSPIQISASNANYLIPTIIRNNITQSNTTTGAYPLGIPSVSSYQWQRSTNGGSLWTSIAGATGPNYTPPANSTGTILYRRIINGDACNRDTTAIATVTINPIAGPTATNNGPVCSGQTLQLFASTITGATYSWTGPNGFTSTLQNPTIPNSTSVVAGTYSVVATMSATQCASNPSTTTVTIRTGPTANAGQPRSICANTSTTLGGSPTASGGTGPYTYVWSPGGAVSSNPVVTPASTTTYFVTVRDANNCSATASVVVTTSLSLSVSATAIPTTCGLINGSASVSALSGTGPFHYIWNTGGTTSTISNLASGIYLVTLTDAIGCSANTTTTVGASAAVTLSPAATSTSCGLANGSASVSTLTGLGPFAYIWNTGATTSSISALTAGTYRVTATGTGNCSASASATVGASTAVTVSSSVVNTACGLNTGSATVTVLTGTGPFAYSWNTGNTTASISNLASGIYRVTVTGAGSCSASASATVGASVAVTLSPSSASTTCGLNNGSAGVTVLTGVSPYAYIWNNGNTSAAISALASGTYRVTVTGSGNCSASASAVVGTSVAVTLTTSPVNTTCGLSNGSATVTVLTGAGPISYLWNTGSTTAMISNLNAATYGVTATGAGGCSANTSVTVGSSVSVTLSPTAVNTSCGLNNGTAAVSILTGVGPFSYVWSSGATTSSISGLSSGTYRVTATGNGGCSASASAVVGTSSAVTISASAVTTTCGLNNGSVSVTTLTGVSPFTYLWNNGSTNSSISGLAAAVYRVTVTGAGGCSASASATVGNSAAVTLSPSSVATSCGLNNGSASVSVITGAGPFSYLWNTGGTSSTINALSPGIYNVTATGLGGCSASAGATVATSTAVTISTSVTPSSCGLSNGTASVTVLTGLGPISYMWNTGSTVASLSALSSGTYRITATGAGGCSASASVSVAASLVVTLSASAVSTSCGLNNGTATVMASAGIGPFAYVWNTGATATTIVSLSPGTYRVTGTGNGGCSATASATVNSSLAITLSPSTVGTTCGKNNGSASVSVLTGVGPYAYVWSNGAVTAGIANLAAGVYKVTVTGASRCTASASVNVSSSLPISVSISSVNTTCGNNNGSATVTPLSGTSPFTYLWSNGKLTASVLNLAPATYRVTVTSSLACTATASVTINSSVSLIVSTFANSASCGVNTGSAGVNVISGMGPFAYNWNNGGTTQIISNLGTGVYSVTVTGLNGCGGKGSANVTIADTIPPVPVCRNITVALDASGAATITAADVDNGSTDNCLIVSRTISAPAFNCANLGSNSVTLTITDSSGHSASCVAVVTVADLIPPVARCKNVTLQLVGNTATITPDSIDNVSTDNCAIVTRTATPTFFDCTNAGPNPATLTVTDAAGNSSTCTAIVTILTTPPVACTLGYPDNSNLPRSAVIFNESEVLRATDPGTITPCGNISQTIKLWYNDEHALTLGVRRVVVITSGGTTTTDYPVTPYGGIPICVSNPLVGTTIQTGDQSGNDVAAGGGRPLWPSLFITDVTNNPGGRSGDWQQGGMGFAPTRVCGSWKAAVRTVDYTVNPVKVTVTPDADPAKNNWVLGTGSDTPPGGFGLLTNEGYGAEVVWDISTLGIVAGNTYHLQFMVHDGDQNKVGGDCGESCAQEYIPFNIAKTDETSGQPIASQQNSEQPMLFDVNPNPASGMVNFSLVPASSGKARLSIFDIQGKLISELYKGETVSGGMYLMSYDTRILATGVYLAVLFTNEGAVTRKLVIER